MNRKKQIKNWLGCFIFALPALFFYCLFLVGPIISTVKISLNEWNGANPYMKWVGLDNYIRVFQDPIFYKALGNNIIWILFTIFVPVLLGLIFAIILSNPWVKGKFLYRLTYFMPNVVSLVAVGIVWGWIYNPEFGIMGKMFRALGLDSLAAIDYLGDEKLVIWFLLIAGSWTCYGFNMVVFLAGLQGIDSSYLEVARLEGANPVQKFFYVIVPLIKGTIVLLVSNSLIGSFKVFDLIYVMTKGGPYHSSEVISTYMYTSAFTMNDYGYGSALAVALAVIIAVCSGIFMKLTDKDNT
ncbi:MAG TPA: sugar ABC transporter permease [Candidatus Pullilachnospira stercoravium]|uniref:Sugar ABC transporter permease n=1 Tax=Candidatus Pullilachnospira stercoravium TaxID=2840913 RepID=A0A9D1NTV1_9FIRM|nr:sugar ABC transporter permease [Candidatus Pullilachnospira stercoravium]